jgi:hypothetical protein
MKIIKIIALALSLPLIFACNEPDDIHWKSLPISIDTAGLSVAQQAIQDYNNYFGQEVFVDDPDGVKILLVDPGEIEKYAGSCSMCTNGDLVGYTNLNWDSEHLITSSAIHMDRFEQWYEPLYIHEFGHLLGFLRHTTDGIMRAKIDSFPKDVPQELDNCPEFLNFLKDIYGLQKNH